MDAQHVACASESEKAVSVGWSVQSRYVHDMNYSQPAVP